MFDIIHFSLILYVCLMSPYLAIQNTQNDWEKVMTTVVFTGLVLNIYIQLTTAVIEKVCIHVFNFIVSNYLKFILLFTF